MFRKIALLLVLVLVIGALSACTEAGFGEKTLTEKEKEDISRAYVAYAYTIEIYPFSELKGKGQKAYAYLGCYNGIDVIYGGSYLGFENGTYLALDSETKALAEQVVEGEKKAPGTVSGWKKRQIANGWKKFGLSLYDKNPENYALCWNVGERRGGCFCYGSYRGYDILYTEASMTMAVISGITIGEETFKAGNPFELVAYKNGTVYDLNTLYEDGKIPAKIIKQIHEIHKQRFDHVYEE